MAFARVAGFEHGLGSGTRATRAARAALEPLLTRGLTGYAHREMSFGAWLEPPRPELTLQIALDGAITADGEPLPTAWLGGLARGHTVVGVGRTYAGVDLKLDPRHSRALVGMPLSELTDACVSLEDLFGDVGLGPKAVARQLRLQALRRSVERGTGPVRWARLAAEHGYADQAHLVRDVRELTGITPAQLLTRRIPEGGLVGDGV